MGVKTGDGLKDYYKTKIESLEIQVRDKTNNLRRLEAQRNELNFRVRLLKEELQLLQEPGSYVGEVVKVMGKKKVLVKVHPEGKVRSAAEEGEWGGKKTALAKSVVVLLMAFGVFFVCFLLSLSLSPSLSLSFLPPSFIRTERSGTD